MSHAGGSKQAVAYLIDPLNAPEPSAETGPGSSFGNTYAPVQMTSTGNSTTSPRTSLGSRNPFRESSGSGIHAAQNAPRHSPQNSKNGVSASERPLSSGSPSRPFPAYRAEAFGDFDDASRRRSGSQGHAPPTYDEANSPSHRHRRRTSSLRERFPGDDSVHPLDIIRRDSRKADRSPHLKKRHLPGADTIDRLDPAIGGRPYHHEGPYDAALLARNTSFENAPIAALRTTNEEAIKATPRENIQDAIERHKPLEGVAQVPPGMPDRFGRTYQYEEGADVMREENNDGPGYKRWPDKEYSPEDLEGVGEPAFSLDKALKAHKINDEGIELTDGSRLNHHGSRDPVDIAGGQSMYVELELANARDNDANVRRSGSLREGLKKRLGSLRKKNRDD